MNLDTSPDFVHFFLGFTGGVSILDLYCLFMYTFFDMIQLQLNPFSDFFFPFSLPHTHSSP
ncbi:hypothetical protein BCR39DRAFT_522357 [Naematelia encephala]|uniref:Uncharacterized protein n=1 Tax=Naematelia encephala TaxID=71784 RepID=A0A1Y2BFQ2_9TREE|nr:hypothetical protein BCR39DRAFT_522357 [Naematelia encephala]